MRTIVLAVMIIQLGLGSPGYAEEPAADVVAADDQISTVLGAAAHEDVHVRIIGVPMILGDPVQPCIKITFGIGDQFAGEGAQVRHLGRILRRNREAEMMPIILTPLRKGLRVAILRGRTEHSRVGVIAGDALTFEIRDMFRKRC